MCHLLLFLPVFALPVFWLLPLELALPVYAVAAGAALWVYALAAATGRRPAMTGAEGMIGERGRVVRVEGGAATVQIHGELWSAQAEGRPLVLGDEAVVIGIRGLCLRVRPAAAPASGSP